jgi:NAD(P)-dependent dehydrogenase (short-subunit alcohol dehydrogenase family)
MNKTIFITGGAQGIGFGIARCFARRNYAVCIADVHGAQATASAESLKADGARSDWNRLRYHRPRASGRICQQRACGARSH